jgi:Ca2+-binding EF-hand superfamily protein
MMAAVRWGGVLSLGLSLFLARYCLAQNGSGAQIPGQQPAAGMSFVAPPNVARVPGFEVPLGFVAPGPLVNTVPLEKRFELRVYERAKESLRDRDRNKSGTLEGEEWTRNNWDPPLAKSDVNYDGVITLEELCYRYQGKSQADNPELWASGKLRVGTIALPPPPLFPGLMGTTAMATSAAAANPISIKIPDDGKLRKFAESMIARSDENGSGKLEREEWVRVREPEAADANRDGVITLEEMMVRLAAFGESRGDKWSRREESAQPQSADPLTSASPYAKSYRPLTVQERLPAGLPAWFVGLDTDADGQVSMAEYLADSDHSDERAEQFLALDRSGDGLLSAGECLDSQPSAPGR